LGALATDPSTVEVYEISQNGVRTACIWMVKGIPWFPGHRGGKLAMVNQHQVKELRDCLGEHRSMPRGDLTQWLLRRRREGFTYQTQAMLRKMVGPDAVRS
jgi:hypothetical protein